MGNEAYRDALRRAATNTPATVTNSVYSPIYSLGPDWPPLRLNQCDDEDTLDNLERYLTKRVTTRNTLGTVLICGYQIKGRKVKFFEESCGFDFFLLKLVGSPKVPKNYEYSKS